MTYEEIIDVLAERFPASDIEEPFDLAPAVYAAYEEGRIPKQTIRLDSSRQEIRDYLGASGLGEECPRKIWANFRNLSDFPGRILRLFQTGDVYEERMATELAAIGFEVGGDQSRFEAMGGRVAGHTDRFARLRDIEMPWLLTEMKTANHKSVTRLKKHRRDCESESEALRKWKPTYHGQIHLYMVAFDVPACLYLVTNKDKDELVNFLVERDDSAAVRLQSVAREVLESEGPPARAYERAKTPECTIFCDHSEWCWYDAELPERCGSCIHWRDGCCGLTGEPAVAVCEQFERLGTENEDAHNPWAEGLM